VLRNYAFILDGKRGAHIDPDGAIGWLRVPEWDTLRFSAMLGGRIGCSVTLRIAGRRPWLTGNPAGNGSGEPCGGGD